MSPGWKEFQETGKVSPEQAGGDKPGLLVVDDESGIVESLKEMFQEHFTIYHTTSSNEALELFKQHKPRLVISDQRMPELSGLDLFARIKVISPDSVRILITGYSDINVAIQAINDELVWKYITKPWDHTQLKELVLEAGLRRVKQGDPPDVWKGLLGM